MSSSPPQLGRSPSNSSWGTTWTSSDRSSFTGVARWRHLCREVRTLPRRNPLLTGWCQPIQVEVISFFRHKDLHQGGRSLMQRQSWLLWVDGSWRLLLPVEPRPQDWLRLRPHRAGDGPHQHEGRLAAGGRRQGGRPAGQRLRLLPHLVAPRVKKGSLAVVDLILSFKAIEMLTTSCLRSSKMPLLFPSK